MSRRHAMTPPRRSGRHNVKRQHQQTHEAFQCVSEQQRRGAAEPVW